MSLHELHLDLDRCDSASLPLPFLYGSGAVWFLPGGLRHRWDSSVTVSRVGSGDDLRSVSTPTVVDQADRYACTRTHSIDTLYDSSLKLTLDYECIPSEYRQLDIHIHSNANIPQFHIHRPSTINLVPSEQSNFPSPRVT